MITISPYILNIKMVKLLIFDTETNDMIKTIIKNSKREKIIPYIIQLSWLIYDTKTEKIESKHDYIISIPDDVIITKNSEAIHHISKHMCKTNGIDITKILPTIIDDMFYVDKIIAHNISFDKSLLEKTMERYSFMNPFDSISIRKKMTCTMNNQEIIKKCNLIYTRFDGVKTLKFPKLSELHNTLFKDNLLTLHSDKLHNAFIDNLILLRCYVFYYHNIDIYKKYPRWFSQLTHS